MKCSQIQQLIELHALNALDSRRSEQVQEHLERCHACARVDAEVHGLIRGLKREFSPPSPNLTLVQSALARSRRELRCLRRQRQRSTRLFGGMVAAGIAGILILWAVGLGVGGLKPAPVSLLAAGLPQTPLWEKQTNLSIPSTAADDVLIHGNRMFVMEPVEGIAHVTALERHTGQVLWQTGHITEGYLSCDDRHVYGLIHEEDGPVTLVALDMEDGHLAWRCPCSTPGGLHAAQPLSKGRLAWSCGDRVLMVDARSGQPLWQRQLPDQGTLSEATEMDHGLYVAGHDKINCLDLATGEVTGQICFDCRACSSMPTLLAADDHCLYVAAALRNGKSRVLCLDTRTQACLWDKCTPRVSDLVADEGKVFLRCQHVYALDRISGNPLWHYRATGCSPLTLQNGIICFVDTTRQGALTALKGCDGGLQWKRAGVQSCNALQVEGKKAYLKTTDSVLHAFSLDS